VITSSGDSLVAAEILNNKTNENQVTFIIEGDRKILKAKEVKSYYKKGRKISIFSSSDSEHKLAKVVVRGTVKLAEATSSKGFEKFYILVDGQWINLDPHAFELKEYLSALLPDFEEAVKNKKVHYDLASLGKAIAKYNEFKDPTFKVAGAFRFKSSVKGGVYGTLGSSIISIRNFDGDLGRSLNHVSFGAGMNFQFSRLFSTRLRIGYDRSNWSTDEWDIKLRTFRCTPLLSARLYQKSRFFKLSASAGLSFNFDTNSKIIGPFQNDQPVGLGRVGLGYEFQLHSLFREHFEVFAAYQFLKDQQTTPLGVTDSKDVILFNTNQIKLGAFFYF